MMSLKGFIEMSFSVTLLLLVSSWPSTPSPNSGLLLVLFISYAHVFCDRWLLPSSVTMPGQSLSWTPTVTRRVCWTPSTRSPTKEETLRQVRTRSACRRLLFCESAYESLTLHECAGVSGWQMLACVLEAGAMQCTNVYKLCDCDGSNLYRGRYNL